LESKLDDLTIVSRSSLMHLWRGVMDTRYREAPDGRVRVAIAEISAEEAERGLSRSIRTGMKTALREEAEGILIILADQPLVTAAMLDRLMERFLADPGLHYVAYHNGDAPSPPMLISSRLFSAMRKLDGDQGARALIRQPGVRGLDMRLEQPERLLDLDTEHDWFKLERLLKDLG
jgi:CTP:molybdopterin cytidylyltransferase MocA